MKYWKLFIYLHVFIECWIIECFAKRLTDFEEQITLEREILSLMGFPEAPKNPDKVPNRKRSAPTYMINIYNNDQYGTFKLRPSVEPDVIRPMAVQSKPAKPEPIIIAKSKPDDDDQELTSTKLQPNEDEPAKLKPDEDEPAKLKPDEDEPAKLNPDEDEPAKLKPDEDEPAKLNPDEDEPDKLKPDEDEPAKLNPDEDEPAKLRSEPVEVQKVNLEPHEDEPAKLRPELDETEGVKLEPNEDKLPKFRPEPVKVKKVNLEPHEDEPAKLRPELDETEGVKLEPNENERAKLRPEPDNLPVPPKISLLISTPEPKKKLIEKNNVMLNFAAVNPFKGGKPDNVRRMWFNISGAPNDANLTHAELKLFRITKGLERKFRNAYRVVMYRIYHDNDNKKALEEVNSVITEAGHEGWMSINVTNVVDYWIKNPRENRGVKILVVPVDRAGRRVNPEATGIVGFNGDTDKQPFIAAFYNNHNKEPTFNESQNHPNETESLSFTLIPVLESKKNLIHKNDMVMNFAAVNPFKGGKPDNVRRMWFNISGAPNDANLTHAELKLFRITKGLERKFRNAYRVVMYRIYHDNDNKKALEEVNSVITEADYEGWMSINVTNVVDYWIKNPRENRGVKILVVPVGSAGRRVNPETTGIVGFNGDTDKQPFVAAFYNNHNKEPTFNESQKHPNETGSVNPLLIPSLGSEKNLIHKSDVIISFMATNPFKGGKPDNVRRMWFDISGASEDDRLTHAELKLFRITKGLSSKFRGSYCIVVYRVYYDGNGQKAFDEVNSVITKADYEGWISINVTRAVDYWIKNPEDYRSLKIIVFSENREGYRANPESTGIVGFDGEADKQPFIAGFYKNLNYYKIQLKLEHLYRRFKRSSDHSSLALLAKLKSKNKATVSDSPNPCSRKFFHVSFRDIRWHEWIIAPEGYDAYYCDGKCDFPLSKRTNPTNHAIVQSAFQAFNPKTLVPKPCCAPTKLSSLSLLYFLDNNNVVYRKYRNMVVNECGCQ